MSDSIENVISFLTKNAKITLTSFVLGIACMYLIMTNVIVVHKDVVIAEKEERIRNIKSELEAERGTLSVQNERLKLMGDRVSYFQEKLGYLPEDTKLELESLKSENNHIKKELAALTKIKATFESQNKEKFDFLNLTLKLESLEKTKKQLEKELNSYRNKTVVSKFRISKGHSWSGFGGEAIVGLVDVDIHLKASVTGNFVPKDRIVKPGDTIDFDIAGKRYRITIDEVHYVGDYIIISVFQKTV